jgi:RNA recognition motif-containing protein
MSKRIYVGNLPFNATEESVRELFSHYGTVDSVNLITDRETGRPRGFGFVEMADEGAVAAIAALDKQDFGGRALNVNEARPRDERGGGGDRGGFRPRNRY